MPYLRLSCPELSSKQKRVAAERLTDAVNDLFFNPHGQLTREELCEHTTVHFQTYATGDLFIGSRTPDERGTVDVTVELSDWSMSIRKQRAAAERLTPILAELFDVPLEDTGGINIRFHSYPPTDFAVGGHLLSDLVPRMARFVKRLFG